MRYFIVLAMTMMTSSAFGAFTFTTAPTNVEAQFNVEETTQITIESDQADTMRRIRLIGLTSSDSQNCVKTYTANESCTFNISKTITSPASARIYLYPKDSSRTLHTIRYTVAVSSTRDDLSSGISFFGSNVSGNQVDFGNLTLAATAGTRVYVKNTGNQKTSAIQALSSNYTGSSSYTLLRSSCDGVELEKDETCYFDVRLNPSTAQEGSQTGTFEIRTAAQAGSTIDFSAVLTIPSTGGGGDVNIDTGDPTGNAQVRNIEVGQSFLINSDSTLDEIDIFIGANSANPIVSGNIKIEVGVIDPSLVGGVEGDNFPAFSGTYPGTIIGESETLDALSLGLPAGDVARVTFSFAAANLDLTAGTEYFFVVNHTVIDSIGSLDIRFGTVNTNVVDGSRLFNTAPTGSGNWLKLATYPGASNQEDYAYALRATGSGSGGSENISTVDYFCTQEGVDNAGYTSPPFCAGVGQAVEIQYISDCFINPTWCSLNTQSENSVIASTNGSVIGFRRHRLTTPNAFNLVSNVTVTFVQTSDIEFNGVVQNISPLFTGGWNGVNDFSSRPTTSPWVFGGATSPYRFQRFQPFVRRGTYGAASNLGPLLNSSLRYDGVNHYFNLETGDLLLTDAQIYTKYEDEILNCFSVGGDLFQVNQIETRPKGDLTPGIETPHGTPTLTNFRAYCGLDPATQTGTAQASGQLDENIAAHGYDVDISASNSTEIARSLGSSQVFDNYYPDVFSIQIIKDYGVDLEENVLLKYLEVSQSLD